MTARIVALWLRATPDTLDEGQQFPWRRQAAAIAIAVAREFQARREEREDSDADEERIAYEAALLAAVDSPDEVAELCLELARRRLLRQDVQVRAALADAQAAEFMRGRREEDPAWAAQVDRLCRPVLPEGELGTPWPDGPSQRVSDAFRDACLNTEAFICLGRSRPATAREVLLAVCVEEPQRSDPHECYVIPENCGVEHWFEGYPPLYDRGPFLAFLRERQEEAIEFTLRLINFATHRGVEADARQRARHVRSGMMTAEEADDGVVIDFGGSGRQWFGNPRVFRWHHDARTIRMLSVVA